MKTLFLIVIFLVQYGFTQSALTDSSTNNRKPKKFVGQELPNITLCPLYGKSFQLSSLKGNIVVLNCWFTTCVPCQQEIPELDEIVSKYKKKNIRFISIARNTSLDLQRYLKGNAFTYEQTLFTDSIYQTFDEYFPRNIIIDKNGVVVFDKIGYSPLNAEAMTKKLEELLDNK